MKSFSPESEAVIPRIEHLKVGVPAIMACVGTIEQFRRNPGAEKFAFQEGRQELSGADNVNFYGYPHVLAEQNFKNPEDNSYVISPIDGLDKFSQWFGNCTGLVVAGYDKQTGENLSFLTHQNPAYFLGLDADRDSFVSDLRKHLSELKEKCGEGTIDAAIVGGTYFKGEDHEDNQIHRENYLDSIELLSGEVSSILGFEPIVMTGPKTVSLGVRDNVFYENQSRRLYISRPKVGDGSTESFTPGNIKEQEKKW
jgi:hypothetical protein